MCSSNASAPRSTVANYATYRYFGSWREALCAAGLTPKRIWSKERVIEALQRRHREGLPMLDLCRHDGSLAAAAHRYFGSYEQALVAAGLPPVRARDRLTRQDVLAEFRQRFEQQLPLVRFWRDDLDLRAAVRKHFGDWHGVLRAAEIPAAQANRWNKYRVIASIQAINGKSGDAQLRSAARYYFGSWTEALSAAGFCREQEPSRRWTRQGVLDEIQQRHRKGVPMTIKCNKSLAKAAILRFGTWSWALTVAKVPQPTPRTKWSKERVLLDLEMLRSQGWFEDTSRIPDNRLAAAATRHFGSKRQALIAAGILAPHERKRSKCKWNRRRILEAIQDRRIRGLSLRGDANLVGAAKRRFGSLHEALMSAGVRATEPRPRIKWSPQLVVAELQSRHQPGKPVHPTDDSRLTNAAKRYFGSWRSALLAAGLSPRTSPRKSPSKVER